MRAVPGLVKPELREQLALFQERQDEYPPAMQGRPVGAVNYGRGQRAVDPLIVETGQGYLPEASVGEGGGFADVIDGHGQRGR